MKKNVSIVVQNGTIADGSGKTAYPGDILIQDGIIRDILPPGTGTKSAAGTVIDATGQIVAPGFIDTHSHNDIACLFDDVVAPKLFQGITTDLLGQDGLSAAPCPRDFETWKAYLKEFYGSEALEGLEPANFVSVGTYMDAMERRGQGSNKGVLVPLGNIRFAVMGGDSRPADEQQLQAMETLLVRELEAGAAGISTGLIYPPCSFSNEEELIRMCRVSAKYHRPFVVHQRSEADDILSSMDELFRVARGSGCPLHISHFKICGFQNGRLLPDLLKKLDAAENEGIELSFDLYPYMAGSTSLSAALPPWTKTGGLDETLFHLGDPESRRRILDDFENGIPGWDNFAEFAGFPNIFITSVESANNRSLIGRNLADIAEMRSVSPGDALLDLLLEERCEVGMVDIYGEDWVLEELLKRRESNLCTDGLFAGTPHPRTYGAFPRFLGEMVRRRRLFSLEEAVRKMTSKGAEVFGWTRRGLIKSGCAADIVIFHPESVDEAGTFAQPRRYPEGISHVLVNGTHSVSDGSSVHSGAGEILRS